MKDSLRVAVVGGGITGLSAAYYLQQLSAEAGVEVYILLLERERRWGGKIRTERVDGFVIEAGPDTFVSTKPWAVELCRELGIDDRLMGTDPARRRVYVLQRGRLVELPEGLASMVPTRWGAMLRTPLLSPLGKLRLGLDLVIPPRPGDQDESLAQFITRRLGPEAYTWLIEPLMSGIYAGDGERLSLLATFPYLREWEQRYRSLARGARCASPKHTRGGDPRRQGSIFFTPRRGLGELTEALVSRLPRLGHRLGVAVRAVTLEGGRPRLWMESGEAQDVDAVILATPAFVSADLLDALDPALASLLRQIEYVSAATVSLGYRLEDLPRPLDGHGYVIPRREGRPALACSWTSTKFPHRAPEGHALLRVFFGRAGQPDILLDGEQDVVRLARAEVAETLGVQAMPILVRVGRWPRAMPQYNLGHRERIEVIRSRLATLPGIFLGGAGYEGIGIPDCIRSGREAARSAFSFLKARSTALPRLQEAG